MCHKIKKFSNGLMNHFPRYWNKIPKLDDYHTLPPPYNVELESFQFPEIPNIATNPTAKPLSPIIYRKNSILIEKLVAF